MQGKLLSLAAEKRGHALRFADARVGSAERRKWRRRNQPTRPSKFPQATKAVLHAAVPLQDFYMLRMIRWRCWRFCSSNTKRDQ